MFGGVQNFGASAPSAMPATMPDAGAKKPRQEEKQTCLPVTVRLIQTAVEQRGAGGGEGLQFHGTEHGVLILVGLVETWMRQSASAEFTINDGTGRLKARYYSSSDSLKDIAPGRYVSLFGQVRTAPTVHFAVAGMGAVESVDEVSFHMIEVAHAAVKLGGAGAEMETPPPRKPVLRTAGMEEPATGGLEAVAAAPLVTTPPKTEPLSGKTLRAEILRFLKSEGEEKPEGVGFMAVCAHVGSTPAREVTTALEGLVGDGDIFTTIDDEHFQCV